MGVYRFRLTKGRRRRKSSIRESQRGIKEREGEGKEEEVRKVRLYKSYMDKKIK